MVCFGDEDKLWLRSGESERGSLGGLGFEEISMPTKYNLVGG